jgi:hypothetical protein
MPRTLYSACVGESRSIADGVTYDALLLRIAEFTLRAAWARSIDESEWEHEELRRHGLGAIAVFRDGRAVWSDSRNFELELAEARRERVTTRFKRTNEYDAALYDAIDRDLQAKWRLAGYHTPSLRADMKMLFKELESDINERASGARTRFFGELVESLVGSRRR